MRKKLLVADDSVTIQKVVSLTFAGEDIAIESVANGDLAIGRVKEFKPDLVLADVLMPGCTGYEVCARIKSDPELSRIPVVLIVGTFEPFDEAEAARVKCDAWLTKPFDTSELLRVVHSLMGIEPGELMPVSESARLADASDQGIPMPTLSDRTLTSFLGDQRVLDLFGPENQPRILVPPGPSATMAAEYESVPRSASAGELSEETLNMIVERVVRRMSQDVIREIAWEVVPELSEQIIRRTLEEKNNP